MGFPSRCSSGSRETTSRAFRTDARFEGNPEIKTGPDGSFKTPKELERKPSEFRVEVAAEVSYRPARRGFPCPRETCSRFPTSLSSGRGASASSRAGSSTATASRSRGPRSRRRATGRAGRRPRSTPTAGSGCRVSRAVRPWSSPRRQDFGSEERSSGTQADAVEIRLARASEPPIATLKTLPSPLSRAEERALARELLEPLLPLARSGSLGYASPSVIPLLARVDPARVLDMIENRAIAEPFVRLDTGRARPVRG